MTRDEFYDRYARRSRITKLELVEFLQIPAKCQCDDENTRWVADGEY